MALKKELKLENRKEEFLMYYNQKLSDREIGEKLGVFRKTVGVYRKSLGLPPNKRDPLNLLKKEFISLYNKGLSDGQIAKEMHFSRTGIGKLRTKLNMPINNNISNNDLVIIKELEALNYSSELINKLVNQSKNYVVGTFSNRDLAIIIGILLGDGNIHKSKNNTKNCCFTTEHCPSQKLYSIHIATVLQHLNSRLYYSINKTADVRNNKYYESYIVRFKSSKLFNYLYDIFYKDGVKTIPDYIYDYYTAESLAYQFMDDGSKLSNSYKIATNCFTISELQKFQYFLLTKFNLKTTIHKDHGLYIRKESAERFKSLVEPYIIDSMKYKLH